MSFAFFECLSESHRPQNLKYVIRFWGRKLSCAFPASMTKMTSRASFSARKNDISSGSKKINIEPISKISKVSWRYGFNLGCSEPQLDSWILRGYGLRNHIYLTWESKMSNSKTFLTSNSSIHRKKSVCGGVSEVLLAIRIFAQLALRKCNAAVHIK